MAGRTTCGWVGRWGRALHKQKPTICEEKVRDLHAFNSSEHVKRNRNGLFDRGTVRRRESTIRIEARRGTSGGGREGIRNLPFGLGLSL